MKKIKSLLGIIVSVIATFSTFAQGTGTGLTGRYYNGLDFVAPDHTQVDATIDFSFGNAPISGSVRWTGQVEPLYSETYTFACFSDNGSRVWINGKLVVDDWGGFNSSGTIDLVAGQKYDIRIDYWHDCCSPTEMHLFWQSASQGNEVVPQTQLYPADSSSVTSGLAAYYPFSTDTSDASGNSNNGTLNNATIGAGYNGNGLLTTGADDSYVDVAQSDSVNLTNAVTISLWVKANGFSNTWSALAYNSAGGLDVTNDEVYGLWLSSSGSLQWESVPDGTTNLMSVATSINPSIYNHIVAIIDAANDRMALYVNGEPMGTNTYAGLGGLLRSGAQPLRLGGFPLNLADHSGLSGVIDEVRIYNRALSANEIATLSSDSGTIAPTIVSQPSDTALYQNQSYYWAVYATGTPNLSYIWSLNGADIPGATSATYSLNNAQFTNAGTYSVIVSNAYGTATSAPFTLTVQTNPPSIIQGPATVVTNAGANATFSVTAASEGPMTYQWWFNNTMITNATDSAYTVANVQKQNCGYYYCVVSNNVGGASAGAQLGVTYTNPFEIAQGKYNGAFGYGCYWCYYFTNAGAGNFSVALTKKGKFTGKIVTDGDSVPISGQFPTNTAHPSFTTNVSRAKFGKSDLTIYLSMDLENWPETISGWVNNPDSTSFSLSAPREAFSTLNPATAYQGSYTMILNANGGSATPQGYGYATIKVNSKGVATVIGFTQDGQSFSESYGLARDGSLPLYGALYKTTHNYFDNSKNPPVAKVNPLYRVGHIFGSLSFTGGSVSGWYELFKGDTTGYAYLYPAGFLTGNNIVGSPFTKIDSGTPSLTTTNGNFLMYGGDLTQTWSYGTQLLKSDAFVFFPQNNPANLTIAPTLLMLRGSGTVSGRFLHPDLGTTKKAVFKGAVLQNQNSVYGYFLGQTSAGAFYDNGY